MEVWKMSSGIHRSLTQEEVSIMKRVWLGCTVLFILLGAIGLTGCVTTFTSGGQLQIGLSASANETAEILADFEASEASAVAGDVTKKAGSICAGGACIIY